MEKVEKRVNEARGWKYMMEEKMGLIKFACQNYEVPVIEKNLRKDEGVAPSKKYNTQDTRRREDSLPK